MEVTREQYLNALEVVDSYHRQGMVLVKKKLTKTPILQWEKFKDCSYRLQSALSSGSIHWSRFNDDKIEYIEDITRTAFLRLRNMGTKSWREFEELRGY